VRLKAALFGIKNVGEIDPFGGTNSIGYVLQLSFSEDWQN
jgi:hypothetical protein